MDLEISKDLKTHFKESYDKEFIDIDTCTLHKVHISFKEGVFHLPIDIDNFNVNLHGFFNSYWKDGLNYCGLFVDEDRPKSKYVRVDTY